MLLPGKVEDIIV